MVGIFFDQIVQETPLNTCKTVLRMVNGAFTIRKTKILSSDGFPEHSEQNSSICQQHFLNFPTIMVGNPMNSHHNGRKIA